MFKKKTNYSYNSSLNSHLLQPSCIMYIVSAQFDHIHAHNIPDDGTMCVGTFLHLVQCYSVWIVSNSNE